MQNQSWMNTYSINIARNNKIKFSRSWIPDRNCYIFHSANFLDTTLDKKTGTYRLYRKPNDTPLYLHTSSNHPQQILKQLPLSINQYLSRNSSNSSIFYPCKDEYEVALKRSEIKNVHLSYIDNQRTKRKNNPIRNT